jgi:hypothetical protein
MPVRTVVRPDSERDLYAGIGQHFVECGTPPAFRPGGDTFCADTIRCQASNLSWNDDRRESA